MKYTYRLYYIYIYASPPPGAYILTLGGCSNRAYVSFATTKYQMRDDRCAVRISRSRTQLSKYFEKGVAGCAFCHNENVGRVERRKEPKCRPQEGGLPLGLQSILWTPRTRALRLAIRTPIENPMISSLLASICRAWHGFSGHCARPSPNSCIAWPLS